MALNFDAQINVDVAPFIQNIARAKASVAALEKQINALNSKKITIQASAVAANDVSGISARKAASNAAMQSMAAEEQMAKQIFNDQQRMDKVHSQALAEDRRRSAQAAAQEKRESQAAANADAKVEWQAEMMRKSAMDARVKDHRTKSNLYEDAIALQRREGKIFSDSIRAQMTEREQMNKVHAQALGMNERRDAAIAKASGSNVRNMARERYALYDVAAAYQQVASMAGIAIREMAGTAIAYERSFADVQRTTDFTSIKVGEAARVMKFSLMEVASEIPVAFGKVTEIATIANQLGIAQGEVAKFSKTVAQFATTTGMTAESAAMSFGRIGELMNVESEVGAGEDAYAKLGSAIAYAGVKAVATETQITSVTKEIATTAKMAKFSTADVVGLATALASVGIAPEAARGSIMRTFAGINEAVAKGGASLEKYASISGMSASEFSKSWTDNGQVAFDSFVKGLQGMSNEGQNLDTVLRVIGLKNVRDIQTVQKLGDNYDVYAESIRNANKAFDEGTYLNESYAKIQDTVAAKLELLRNNWDNFVAGLGESVVGDAFKLLLDGINNALKAMTDMSRSPVGYWLGAVAIGVSSLVAIIGTLAGVMALGQAAFLAFGTAMESMGTKSSATAVAGLATVDGALVTTAATATGATGALSGTRMAMLALGSAMKAAGWIATLAAAAAVVVAIGDAIYRAVDPMGAMTSRAESMLNGFAGLQDAVTSDTAALKENAQAAGMTEAAYAAANGVILVNTDAVAGNDQAAKDAIAAHNGLMNIVGNEPSLFTASANGIASQTLAIGANTQAWLKNAIAQSDDFKNLAKNKDFMSALNQTGYNFNDALSAASKGKIDNYFKGLRDKFAAMNKLSKGGDPVFGNVGFLGSFGTDFDRIKDAIGGAYNEVLLLGLGSETAAKKVADTFKVPVATVKQLGDAAKNTKKAVKTVVDYASQLVSIFKRIDDIKFSKRAALDDVAAGWQNIKDEAADAADAIKKAQESIDELSADKGKIEYQLSVAVRYGDTKREAILRAQLAKKTTEIADAEKAKAKAQESSTKSLEADTAAGAKNRAGLVDMLGKYQSYIQALAATGMKGTALETEIANLKNEFIAKGKEIGYNTTELGLFVGAFDDYAKAVHDTPRDVTVEFDASKTPGFNAVQEYLAKEHLLNVKVVRSDDGTLNSIAASTGVPGVAGGASTGGGSVPKANPINTAYEAKYALNQKIKELNTGMQNSMSLQQTVALSQQVTTIKALLTKLTNLDDKLTNDKYLSYQAMTFYSNERSKIIAAIASGDYSGKYASGGFVKGPGSGTSDSIPARLSNGEFVVRAAAVSAYGLDFMNSLNQMKVGSMPAMTGGSNGSASGSQVVYLSPDDRALLRAAIDRPVNLYTESSRIASSANAGNTLLAQRGLN